MNIAERESQVLAGLKQSVLARWNPEEITKQVLASQENRGQGTPPTGNPYNENQNNDPNAPQYKEPKDKDGPPGY